MSEVLQKAASVAASAASVLIQGETGVGKELVARHIHECSGRSGPFVAVHPASTSETLFESEFFGHERGAFTGAAYARKGFFEEADQALEPAAPTEIIWEPKTFLPFHPNGMKFEAVSAGKTIDSWTIFSVGGGRLANEDTKEQDVPRIYPLKSIAEILEWCNDEGRTYWEYVEMCEGPEIWDYLDQVWTTMTDAIQRGLNNDGVLPGGLKVRRKASTYMVKARSFTDSIASSAKIFAYALATLRATCGPPSVNFAGKAGKS